ncbi:MAG: metallophosphoesterase [Clostridia bacterium]|nr:metallophosphoesterase [Clostridia bacterium]
MSIFAISDLHLSTDERIKKPMDIYGGEWVNHAEKIKENWLRSVKARDTVLIPGDISWALRLDEAAADFKWIAELPGRKIITKGNHDLWWASTNKLNKLYGGPDMLFLQNHCTEAENLIVCGSRGWTCPGCDDFSEQDEKIYNRELVRMELSLKEAEQIRKGRKIAVMLHYPPTNDKFQPSGFTRLFEKFGVSLVVYGHLHGRDSYGRGYRGNFNGVEYKLVSFDYLKGVPIEIKL